MESQKVWVPDPTEGYILGRIRDIGFDGEVTVVPVESKRPNIVSLLDRVFYADEYDKDVDDNCEYSALMYLNPATLLNNIRIRYKKDKIYVSIVNVLLDHKHLKTYVANILIAVNPYFEIKDLYSSNTIKSYQGKSLGVLPPHVFAIADKSFRDMKVLKQSQSIIVSGESGAGKTESTKYLLRYLCDLWGSSAGPIEQKILDANPVMEAFGNAKTTRNNNSSRFGKFMEVHFNSKCQVVGGYISHYLLEKSRICMQGPEERDYHVFYLLCAGAPESLRRQLDITKPDDFHYLKHGCTQYFTSSTTEKQLNNSQKSKAHQAKGSLRDPILDDVKDFNSVDQALARLGLTDAERLNIYTTVAAVLHLGNIVFEERPEDTKGGCMVSSSSEKSLVTACKLMGVDPGELKQALVSKVMQTARGGLKGTVIMVPLKVYEANNARDALAKAVYSKMFDYIVQRINKSIPFQASSYYIGVLDIAGFEFFKVNSFEQFCINYCNEKLQQFFNERILKDEQQLYEREALQVPKISFNDNQDCIDLIEAKGVGIFHFLDEESKLPKPASDHFTMEVHRQWSGHFRLAFPRTSKLKDHREIRDGEGFMVRHFAGAVCYQTAQFIEKNNDALHASLEGLIQESKNPFLQGMFASSNLTNQKGKLAFISVGSKFKTQLGELMDKLKSTGTNFIRCIKPNQKMIDHNFEAPSIMSQLESSGMTSVLELMQEGFPSRAKFNDLHTMYQKFLPSSMAKMDSRTFCKSLLHALGMNENDYRFGVTRVFFRPGKYAEFDAIMKSDPDNLAAMVAKVKKWLIASQWKKAQWCSLSVIKLKNKILYRKAALVVIQRNVRMHLAQRQHRPRYQGISKIKGLQERLTRMSAIVNQLKKDKESSVSEVQKLQADMTASILKIKSDVKISASAVDRLYVDLLARSDRISGDLQKKLQQQKSAEEQQRLRKIQEEMEREKKLKEEEERRKKEEEETRRLTAAALQAQLEKEALEDTRYREQLEQERRDHELALRLAQETNGQVEDMNHEDSMRCIKDAVFRYFPEIFQSRNPLQLHGLNRLPVMWCLTVVLMHTKEGVGSKAGLPGRESTVALSDCYELCRHVEAVIVSAPPNVFSACFHGDTVSRTVSTEVRTATTAKLNRSELARSVQAAQGKQKHDLSKWKYSELRDTINTSCDIELLEVLIKLSIKRNLSFPQACRIEFHRRLKVYHAWKAKNKRRTIMDENERAPRSVMDAAAKVRTPRAQVKQPINNNSQRYFRIPFIRPSVAIGPQGDANNKRGWWYAHFDGEFVARQMELHPDKPPILLVAGTDDMQMCELSLDETGLTRKRGAEILEHEFNREWEKNSGKVYLRPADRTK
uniref:Myosin motor domain-containing protein n=1 Tax=Timema monikensis TaxID=170555 RepID=A0A7R9DY96_9NEOP|nr:unnamed protein product [Timema monikensis]